MSFLFCFILFNTMSFRTSFLQMSQFIVQCLNPYRKPDCKLGRISNTEDFKHLARKVRQSLLGFEYSSCLPEQLCSCDRKMTHTTGNEKESVFLLLSILLYQIYYCWWFAFTSESLSRFIFSPNSENQMRTKVHNRRFARKIWQHIAAFQNSKFHIALKPPGL